MALTGCCFVLTFRFKDLPTSIFPLMLPHMVFFLKQMHNWNSDNDFRVQYSIFLRAGQ